VFNGDSGIALPGGTIGWAAGTQMRQSEFRENVQSDLYNGNQQCDWPTDSTVAVGGVPTASTPRTITDPLFTGCTLDAGGPFVFFGTNPPDYADQQQYSLFGELQLPVLDNFNLQAAVRKEEFSGGLGETVYKVSGKWDVWGPLSLRGSYGTNYQAPPAGLIPGDIANGVNSYTRAGGAWLGAQTVTRGDIVAETAKAANIGVIWQSDGFAPEHSLSVIVDYFDIETENELGLLATANEIADGVFRYNSTAAGQANPTDTMAFANRDGTRIPSGVGIGLRPLPTGATAYADCSHPLVLSGRVQFNGGACVQGTTQASALNLVRTDYGNGPGQHTAGYDVQVMYDLPFFGGDLTLMANATYTTKDENTASVIDGFTIKPIDDRLGDLNYAVVGFASPEIRANVSANYRMDRHNFRLAAQYVSGVDDERGPIALDGYLPGTTLPTSTELNPTTYGVEGADWLSFDFTYLFDITDTLRLTATVANILDNDPPYSRQELSYDPRMGNPLGRTIEVGLKKTF